MTFSTMFTTASRPCCVHYHFLQQCRFLAILLIFCSSAFVQENTVNATNIISSSAQDLYSRRVRFPFQHHHQFGIAQRVRTLFPPGKSIRPRNPSRFGVAHRIFVLVRGGATLENEGHVSEDINDNDKIESYELVQVQIIHRHGDRTPVTPLHNRTFWESTLPNDDVLERIGKDFKLIRDDTTSGFSHTAKGGRPYGQLTSLGLLQMIELGTRLRAELSHEDEDGSNQDLAADSETTSNLKSTSSKLFTRNKPLHPRRIKIRSTDFPRTIQSVQALLVGLFPDGFHVYRNEGGDPFTIDIDIRHTKYHIPDPHPRNSGAQETLERELAEREHILERERDMTPLAKKVTFELMRQGVLQDAEAALKVSSGFNVGEGDDRSTITNDDGTANATEVLGVEDMHDIQPLPWGQLAEITKCLKVRDLLHPTICTSEEQDQIMDHASWRWFETLKHPRLSLLAMAPMMTDIVHNAMDFLKHATRKEDVDDDNITHNDSIPVLHIYSAHDSTLMGLMCAFQLDQPALWPPYGSFLKIELCHLNDASQQEEHSDPMKDYFMRFSLNGKVLRCHLHRHGSTDEPVDLVPLNVIQTFLEKVHDETEEHLDEAIASFRR